MMQIEYIHEWALTPQRDGQIADLLAECFGAEFGGRSFFANPHHLRVVLWAEETLVGHIALLRRTIRADNALLPIIGVAEVATHPNWQRQGIASRLLQASMGQMADTGAEFAVLFGDEPLYTKAGFVAQPNQLTFVDMDGMQTHQIVQDARETLMVCALTDMPWPASADIDLLGPLF